MPTYALEQSFNGSIAVERDNYDPNKLNLLGQHLNVYNLGSGDTDKFLSTKLTKTIRFSEITGITTSAIHVLEYGNTHYLFVSIQGTAAATRQFAVYTYNKITEEVGGGGLNTITFPTTTVHTTRGIRPTLRSYTTGTVGVSGTAVTGSDTSWQSDGMCVGSRIGFGSTNPFEITTWYEISAVGSNTSITLNGDAGTIGAGTAYVIEDLRMAVVTTNATVVNGGMFLIKGLRLDGLTGGLVIPAATTVDNIRAVYKLNDAATSTHNIASGVVSGEFTDWQTEYMHGLNNNSTTTLSFYKYNIRAALSPTTGVATLTGSDIIVTGVQAVSGGTLIAFNNGRYCTPAHGPGANQPGIYVTCTNRILRADPVDITNGSTSFFKDQMIEAPPGGTTNLPATVGFNNGDYSDLLDKFIISAYTAPNGRIYVTDYKTDGSQMDNAMCLVWNSYDALSSTNVPFPKLQGQAPLIWAEDGILYIINAGASPTGQAYIYPGFGAHWTFTVETNNLAILPKITLNGLPSRLNKVYVSDVDYISAVGGNDKSLEPVKIYYRSMGIDDNSGEWNLVPVSGSLRSIEPVNEIQFAIAFRTMGDICIPARIMSLALVYESDDALPDEYQWNLGDSNTIDGTFAFIQINAFNEWPLTHTIKIYRSDNNTLALEQNSDGTTFGIFEYYDGSTWVAGLGSNTPGSRRRFRPTSSLPGGVNLYAILSVANS
jgi:hypothetical protein